MEFKWTTWKVAGAALALTGSLAAIAAAAHAAAADDAATIKAALVKRLPKTEITTIDCDKIEGVCEVQARQNLFYIDRSARYLIIGRVYDMETKQDLTAARLLEMNPDMLVGAGGRWGARGRCRADTGTAGRCGRRAATATYRSRSAGSSALERQRRDGQGWPDAHRLQRFPVRVLQTPPRNPRDARRQGR